MDIVLNENAVLVELMNRVHKNENGVRHYLDSAGIAVGAEGVTYQHLDTLNRINADIFTELCYFLYPEMKQVANALPDENASSATLKTNGGSSWSASDWTNMLGTLVNGAGNIVGKLNVNGNTDAEAAAAAYSAAATNNSKDKQQTTIIVVCVSVLVLLVVLAVIFNRGRK